MAGRLIAKFPAMAFRFMDCCEIIWMIWRRRGVGDSLENISSCSCGHIGKYLLTQIYFDDFGKMEVIWRF
jgi:hypothetical protein